MSRRFSSKARKAAARSAPRPREPLHDGEPVGYFAEVTVRQCAIEAPQIKNGAQALPHNGGVTVWQCAIEAPQMKNDAQALPHNDGVTVRDKCQKPQHRALRGTFPKHQRTGTTKRKQARWAAKRTFPQSSRQWRYAAGRRPPIRDAAPNTITDIARTTRQKKSICAKKIHSALF